MIHKEEQSIKLDLEDEIMKAVTLTYNGSLLLEQFK